MTLFRSEEHVQRWLGRTRNPRGTVLSLEQTWRLAKAWYPDPRDRNWRPRTLDESQAVLTSVGLTDAFWQLR